jgi:toxin ParE1/3/4
MKVRWLADATRNLRSIHRHIALENPEAARRVVRAIRRSCVRLEAFPSSGRCGTVSGTRELVAANLPYVIVYRGLDGCVEILRVWHTATNWQSGTA